MNGLMRPQAVALSREFARPAALRALSALVISALIFDCDFSDALLVAAALFVSAAMTTTFEALDAVRWGLPIRRIDVVRAHFGFWLAVLFLPSLAIALGRSQDSRGAVVLFLYIALAVVAAAGVVVFFHRIARRGVGALAMVAGGVVVLPLVGAVVWSLILARTGSASSLLIIAAVACACCASGVPWFLRAEFERPAATVDVPLRLSALNEEVSSRALPPATALLRATFAPLRTGFWVLFGGVLPLLFPTIGIMAVCAPLCADHFAGLGMQTWRWLAATPIDRDRAFRILFGPALAFVVVVVGARFAMTEASDRSVFFRDGRRPGFEDVGAKTVTLASLLETGPSGYGYRPADASKLAVALSGRLRDTFGLTIPPARIEADFRRGWPEHPTPGRTEDHMSYVLDGLERVRLDLGDEIASADRRIDAAIAVGMVLMFLVLLRTGFRDRVLRTVTVILVGTPLAMNGILHREFPRYREATDELFGAIFGSPHAAQWTLVAASCVVGWLLWRSSMNAFRRIDLADIPPNPLGGRSPPRD